MTKRLHFHFLLSCIGEGNGNPLQWSCLEKPRDGGAWWAAIYGVAQSRTRLKRLSSSSSSSCLCSLFLVLCSFVTLTKQLPLTSWSSQSLVSCPLPFSNSLWTVTSQNGFDYQLCADGSLNSRHLLSIAIQTWRCHKGHRFNSFSSSSAYFLFKKKKKKQIYLFVHAWSQFGQVGSNSGLLYWKHRVLATGPSGKSPLLVISFPVGDTMHACVLSHFSHV